MARELPNYVAQRDVRLRAISVAAEEAAAEIRRDYVRPKGLRQLDDGVHHELYRRLAANTQDELFRVHEQYGQALADRRAKIRRDLYRPWPEGADAEERQAILADLRPVLVAVQSITNREQAGRLAVEAAVLGDKRLLQALALHAEHNQNPEGEPASYASAVYPHWHEVDKRAAALMDEDDELERQQETMKPPTWSHGLGELDDNLDDARREVQAEAKDRQDELIARVGAASAGEGNGHHRDAGSGDVSAGIRALAASVRGERQAEGEAADG